MNLAEFDVSNIGAMSDAEIEQAIRSAVSITQEDRKQTQLLYYQPVSKKAQAFHDSRAKVVAAGGGNGSSKTETMLVEMTMCMTGVFPYSQAHLIDQKFRGPISCRLVVESLTATLEPIILPKLMWWRWTGVDQQGGERGHWGWIPKSCLIDGEWERSWSAKLRILRVLCRDPHNPDKILGESSIQFMSKDQDSTDFASGDFHLVGHDEPPKLSQWRENEARTMRVDGRLLLAFTWPDDPAINVDWIFDEIYEPGRSNRDSNITWLELHSTENQNLKQEAIALQAGKWSEEMAGVRIYGRPIRFSNRIHPEFTDETRSWCFKCAKAVMAVPLEHKTGIGCPNCGAENLVDFNHVREFEIQRSWPSVFVLDPHPRKPHMFLWAQISPSDDWWIAAEGKCDGDCKDVFEKVQDIEKSLGLWRAQSLMDPNMGASPSGQRREISWQDEFRHAGLHCDLADDSGVGRKRVNTMLEVDERTHQPRLNVHPRCRDLIYQMQRFVWDNYSSNIDRDEKQTPKAKYDDYPALLRYLANSEPVFHFLKSGAPVITRPGKRKKGGY